MLLSVYMPHIGRDEKDYIKALEAVRNTLVDGRKAEALISLLAATSTSK